MSDYAPEPATDLEPSGVEPEGTVEPGSDPTPVDVTTADVLALAEDALDRGEITPAQFAQVERQLATIDAETQADLERAGSAANAQFDKVEQSIGSFDRIRAWDLAKDMVPEVQAQLGLTDAFLARLPEAEGKRLARQVADEALTRAAKQSAGRETIDDIIARHVARATRRFGH